MSGRPFIAFLVIGATAMGYFFYQTLQKSPQFKNLATEQMASEYSTYTQTFQKVDRLPVGASTKAKFFVPLSPNWKFEIHDKTLIAHIPRFQSIPTDQPPTPEVLQAAKQAILNSLMTWLEDKYHTKKDLLVEVHLQDETSADKTPR